MIDFVTFLQLISETDRKLGKEKGERLVVGKHDKRIGLIDEFGNMEELVKQPNLVTGSNNMGRLTFPAEGGDLILHWGRVVPTGSSAQYNFPIAFPNNCFIILGVQAGGTTSGFKLNAVSKTTYNMIVEGDVGTQTFNWFAIGN